MLIKIKNKFLFRELIVYVNSETNKEIKDNEILFIGCSHTAGSGHGEEVINRGTQVGKHWTGGDTTYPYIFSKALDLLPKIDAHPGRGNYLTEEKLNTYNLRNKKVIIQFSDLYRLRLNGEDIDKWGDYKLLESKHSEVFTDEIILSIFYEQVKRTVNLLRAYNCQFLFFHFTPDYTEPQQKTGDLNFYNEYVNFNNSNFHVDKAKDGKHHGPESMKNIANILLSHWRKLYDE